ncbi:uncharacterized protein LOC129899892 [Solanum dulcamara]|uniref:uncharacterized protein LOC129899892 n=1 Tax=Solanum dulcamara TaxID=45834 RepID=UPI00248649AE|nr:uncharacterized protein LOC129899892 [Solanum dulcamara]
MVTSTPQIRIIVPWCICGELSHQSRECPLCETNVRSSQLGHYHRFRSPSIRCSAQSVAGGTSGVQTKVSHDPLYAFTVSDGRLGSCSRFGSRARVGRAKGAEGASRLRVGSWNIGTLSGKSIELVKILKKRKINIACVQETKWVGPKAKKVDGYKLWFSGKSRFKNVVGILEDSELRDQVVEVRRTNDRMMTIKLVIGGLTFNIISAYAPQVGLDEEIKRRF